MPETEPAVQVWNQQIVEEFRTHGGQVGGPFEAATLALVTTTGARSGKRTTNPLTYLSDGERILIFASNAGGPTNPAWYHNVVANPQVTVEIGAETYPGIAIPLHGEERDRLYARQAQLVPAYAEYQAKTSRPIPVVAVYRRTTENQALA
jgi:deazaflavin-dependent oxidoreductase (nitroreductase family)